MKMKVEEILKLMLFEIIYYELNLEKVEQKFSEKKIPKKQIQNYKSYPILSNYFVLLNDVQLENMTIEEREKLNFYINNLSDSSIKKELYSFLKTNKLRLLLPKTDEKYLYWGPYNFEYMAPSDSIVLGCHYLEFSKGQEMNDEQKNLICNELNKIQEQSESKNEYKVAVIKYNETHLEKTISI